jgi:dephospho-CoA kinase
MTFVVGLTGAVGSGKSAAAERFAALGAAIVDADVIARELTAPGGAGLAPIRAAFGEEAMAADGALDRAAMRRLVFADAAARARLEAILHPLIRAESEARCRLAAADFPYTVLVVPLLVETGGYRERVDRICVVDCPEEVCIARAMRRSGLTRTEAAAIMAAQASRSARRAAADDVIDNARGLAELGVQVAALHEKYRQLAQVAQAAQEKRRTP